MPYLKETIPCLLGWELELPAEWWGFVGHSFYSPVEMTLFRTLLYFSLENRPSHFPGNHRLSLLWINSNAIATYLFCRGNDISLWVWRNQAFSLVIFWHGIWTLFHFLAVFSGVYTWIITAFILSFVPLALTNSKWLYYTWFLSGSSFLKNSY